MLAEVVIAGDGLSAEVAHEAAAAARHPVAALRFDQARPTLDALPHPSCCHALLAAAQRKFSLVYVTFHTHSITSFCEVCGVY